MNNAPVLDYHKNHMTGPLSATPKRTIHVLIKRPFTQQSNISFKLASIINDEGNLSYSTTESMEYMLDYHEIQQPHSTMIINNTIDYVAYGFSTNVCSIACDIDIIISIADNNPYATAKLDVDLITIHLEGTIRNLISEEEIETCTICLNNYSEGNTICTLFCGHTFHFGCIENWIHRNISCPVCRETYL